jgi:hypothetical protein
VAVLLADIHGHSLAAAQDNEDYLTSAVFGHLRYIPPKYLWERLLGLARALPDGQAHKSLDDLIRETGHSVSEYSSLEVFFWPTHQRRGEPDLLLSFTGKDLRPITVVIEAKLLSGKSGGGDEDQLVRYLQILDELQDFHGFRLPDGSLGALLYLTPRESTTEILDSLKLSANPKRDRTRIFRLQWQDFIQACDEPTGEPRIDMTLRDVQAFLKSRGLEYFEGFRRIASLPELRVKRACFNRLFVRLELPEPFAPRRAPWVKRTGSTENQSALH